MAEDQARAPRMITPHDVEQLADFMRGTLDVLILFGVTLANAGLIQRGEIVANISMALDQLTRHGEGNTPARRWMLEALRATFARPVREGGRVAAGLVAIDGGKTEPPSAT